MIFYSTGLVKYIIPKIKAEGSFASSARKRNCANAIKMWFLEVLLIMRVLIVSLRMPHASSFWIESPFQAKLSAVRSVSVSCVQASDSAGAVPIARSEPQAFANQFQRHTCQADRKGLEFCLSLDFDCCLWQFPTPVKYEQQAPVELLFTGLIRWYFSHCSAYFVCFQLTDFIQGPSG